MKLFVVCFKLFEKSILMSNRLIVLTSESNINSQTTNNQTQTTK